MKLSYLNLLKIPDLTRAEKILCIQPHPDDMEIGAGASIARLSKKCITITCVTVTDGSAGTYDHGINQKELIETRKKETIEASCYLGVNEHLWLNFPDGGNLPYEKVRSEITRIIRTIKPKALLVCDPWLSYEAHSDHIRTGMAAAEAFLLSGLPYFCPSDLHDGIEPYAAEMIAFYYTAYPNTFIDVSDTWAQKLKALSCHKSQFRDDQLEMFKELLTMKAREIGKEEGYKYAESFKVLSSTHMHILEQAWQY
ncbi:MAG: PIG-L deacetylase family protein [Bacillota bacterium]|nr:PIG-L deacetylase family protein [Bacillota bacterium]